LSTPANALNVSGSIGGIAQAAGNLASLFGAQAGSWAAALKPASYGNVPFGVEGVRTAAGRKTSEHDYPFRDDVWVEDLGKKARRFEVSGFLVENDLITKQGGVAAQRDAMLAACETAGGQPLVHPTMGRIENVCCLGVEINERRDLGLVFEIRLTLIVSGKRLYPTSVTSSGGQSILNATGLQQSALANFVSSAASAIQQGAAIVQQAVSTAVGWYQFAVTAVNDVKSVIGAVSTLFGNFGRLFGGANNGFAGANPQAAPTVTADDLLSQATAQRSLVIAAGAALQAAAANPTNSVALGTAIQGVLTALVNAAPDPADAVTALTALAAFSPAAVTTPGQIGEAMGTMQVALSALVRRYSLAQLAVTLTTYQPSSQEDAQTVIASASALFDSEITIAGDAGDDDSYVALRMLRQSMFADMNSRAANLATIATFTFQASLPSLVLANRIYRDPTREPGLVQQVNPIHPAFMPTSFQALAS
jgi:prophage DNA circulation protein